MTGTVVVMVVRAVSVQPRLGYVGGLCVEIWITGLIGNGSWGFSMKWLYNIGTIEEDSTMARV